MNSYEFIIRFCKTAMAVNTLVMKFETGMEIEPVLEGTGRLN